MENVEHPLRWPDSWPRTLIDRRIVRNAWKKPIPEYQKAITREMRAMKVAAFTITYNVDGRDPGVAVWYSLQSANDVSWQVGLQIDSPLPTLDQIDSAYKSLAMKHHPDRGGDIEMFKKLNVYREAARGYVLGTAAPRLENCVPMDTFADIKQNLAGVRLFLSYVRGMERLHGPTVVRRIMERTFRTALTAGASNADTAA